MLIRLEGEEGAVFVEPSTVKAMYRAGGDRRDFTVLKMGENHFMLVKGMPDEVHERLFPPIVLSVAGA
jgi:hypothetical protein